MKLFEHSHHWYALTSLNSVYPNEATKRPSKVIYLEGCYCGARRTIEVVPGERPVIMEAVKKVSA